MNISDMMEQLTEENMRSMLQSYRSLGPLPGLALPFLKSFIPPLPTLLIVGVNAAVYGMWLGFLYSWIGMVAGCMVTFWILRRIADHRFVQRLSRRPKVARAMAWIRKHAFSYVFLLSISPVGPFVVINTAAAIARMRTRSFLLAIALGKGIMVFVVSYIGHDPQRYIENPLQLLYIVLLIAVSLLISRKVEARFARGEEREQGVQ
ncbi:MULTISPECIES: TVP38/TMEM64 family protein [unclassified Paenibacillus]|uniref:TVP38/TMEM64 family protein n=1 Tax=unclassified Paenibacillus TaxID=185978 RepID=UPI00093126C6|nr:MULTISPECIES: TVP38/TMEM64 family protein [unclassified Paenibacillus]